MQQRIKTDLLYRPIIRTFLSGLLTLIFSLSITPKIALHSLVANHKDTHSHSDGRTDQLNKAGFSCDCNNQVVESPFLDYSLPALLVAPVFFSDYQATAFQPFLSTTHIIFGLRGPPAIS